jgi:hypothetical protein
MVGVVGPVVDVDPSSLIGLGVQDPRSSVQARFHDRLALCPPPVGSTGALACTVDEIGAGG